jgi:hypothetical protein
MSEPMNRTRTASLDELLTVNEVADELRVDPRTIYGIVKLTAERKNPFHSAGTSSGFEALTSHLGVKNGLKMTSTSHSTILFCRFNR